MSISTEKVINSEHWNTYYSTASVPLLPSQFAAFVAGEIRKPSVVIDIGSGSGRDTFFFAGQGHRAVGIDASETAVNHCKDYVRSKALDCSFIASAVNEGTLGEDVEKLIADFDMERIVYSRFFLHAINEQDEASFFALSKRLLSNGGMIAVEFRTTRDKPLSKVTPSHFRRFINPLELAARAQSHGFKLDYFVEGFGFAKYREDDAHVARMLLSHPAS